MSRRIRMRSATTERAQNLADDTPSGAGQRSFLETLRLWNYRYNVETALYMLSPWERALFNAVVLSVFAYALYSMYSATVYPLYERLTSSHI